MPLTIGPNDAYAVQPVARIKQNLSIWVQAKWQHFRIEYSEGIPPGPAQVIDMVANAGLVTLAAGGTIPKQGINFLLTATNELLQLRWMPLDDVTGILWEQPGQERLMAQRLFTQVDRMTVQRDPYLATTEFFLLGLNQSNVMNLEVFNNSNFRLPQARFMFWGQRYLIKSYADLISAEDYKNARELLEKGDPATVNNLIGPTTWIVAEGRQGI